MSWRDEQNIERWHGECYAKLDLSIGAIESLLAWGTEPREVIRLVDKGCPEELMLRILQPLNDPVILAPELEYSVKV